MTNFAMFESIEHFTVSSVCCFAYCTTIDFVERAALGDPLPRYLNCLTIRIRLTREYKNCLLFAKKLRDLHFVV